MQSDMAVLRRDEQVVLALRNLYDLHGYKKYRMSKFEEYDLYAENRNFLADTNIITFHNPKGKLLALKPDVTLSIAKNIQPSGCDKVYYNENIYRSSGGEFKEITQVGIECIGEIDLHASCEVIGLAEKSLRKISPSYLLDVSHMDFISGILEETALDYAQKKHLLNCIAQKNEHELASLCAEYGVEPRIAGALGQAAAIYGPFERAFAGAKALCLNRTTASALDELSRIYAVLKASGCGSRINLDFSMISDIDYYNGVVFKGFIEGKYAAVLSGGRYDNLLKKLDKRAGAIGFAVYLSLLEDIEQERAYDADVLLLYDDDADIAELENAKEIFISGGKSVRTQKYPPNDLRFAKTYHFGKGGLRYE